MKKAYYMCITVLSRYQQTDLIQTFIQYIEDVHLHYYKFMTLINAKIHFLNKN